MNLESLIFSGLTLIVVAALMDTASRCSREEERRYMEKERSDE